MPTSTSILFFLKISIPFPETFELGSTEPIITLFIPDFTIASAHDPVFPI